MKLIFLHGMPGVGKLTVARELAELTGFKLFHNHLTVDLVGSVFPFGSRQFIALRESIWLDVFARTASENLAGLIFTFAYDRSVPRDFIDKVHHQPACGNSRVEKHRLHSAREIDPANSTCRTLSRGMGDAAFKFLRGTLQLNKENFATI